MNIWQAESDLIKWRISKICKNYLPYFSGIPQLDSYLFQHTIETAYSLCRSHKDFRVITRSRIIFCFQFRWTPLRVIQNKFVLKYFIGVTQCTFPMYFAMYSQAETFISLYYYYMNHYHNINISINVFFQVRSSQTLKVIECQNYLKFILSQTVLDMTRTIV